MKSFKHFFSESNASITMNAHERVVTSGYSDRFLRQTVEYIMTLKINGAYVRAKFDLQEDLERFVLQINGGAVAGMDLVEMAQAIDAITKRQYIISGEIDLNTSGSRIMAYDIVKSITAYLHINTGGPDSYTKEHIAECQEQLKNFPIPNDVLAIVKNQIAECDEYVEKRNRNK